MRKNCQQVVDAWLSGKAHEPARAIWTDGDIVYSYNTPLMVRVSSGMIYLNTTQYTQTTTCHQNALMAWLKQSGASWRSVTNVLRGIAPRWFFTYLSCADAAEAA